MSSPNKIFIGVGINDFGIPGAELQGCHNDINRRVAFLTQECGFLPENCFVEFDGGASKNWIHKKILLASSVLKKGDYFRLAFSSHGSYVPDKNKDEGDGRDEIICLYGINFDKPDTYITDDELGRWISYFDEGVRVEIDIDTCHSGTGTRSISITQAKSRYLPNPNVNPSRAVGKNKATKISQNHILWTACTATQTASDAFIDGAYAGAFTDAQLKAMRTFKSKGANPTVETAYQDICARCYNAGFDQTPQLEAHDPESPLFFD